jgi:hypothetical protein
MVGIEAAVGLITAFALIQGASSVILNSLLGRLSEKSKIQAYRCIALSYGSGLIGLLCVAGSILYQVKIIDFGISGSGEPFPPISFNTYLFIGTVGLSLAVIISWLGVSILSWRATRHT